MLIRSRNNGIRLGLVLLCSVAGLLPTFSDSANATAAETFNEATQVCSMSDTRINEASGLAASAIDESVVYTHNDSGDRPRFFALSPLCDTLATYRINDCVAFDWEDAASAPGADGSPSLYFGDMGDNLLVRDTIRVIEVREPNVANDVGGLTTTVRDADDPATNAFVLNATATYQLSYPDGRHNGEAIAVTNTHDILVITKNEDGIAGLYSTTGTIHADAVNSLRRVAVFALPPKARTTPKPSARELQITGAALAPDNTLLAVRTTDTVWYWPIDLVSDPTQSTVDAIGRAVATTPTELTFPKQSQPEAVAFSADGRDLLTTSEGINAKIYRRHGEITHLRPTFVPPKPSPQTSTTVALTNVTSTDVSATTPGTLRQLTKLDLFRIFAIVAVVVAILIATVRVRKRSRNASR